MLELLYFYVRFLLLNANSVCQISWNISYMSCNLSFSCNMLRLLCSHIALKFTNATIAKINISDIILPNTMYVML